MATTKKAPAKAPAKTTWKPGNLVVPAPAALISCMGKDGKPNLITLAWCGNVNSIPPMLSISVRPGRYSHHMLEETGEFVVNLPNRKMARAVDYCGVVSGRDVDKWKDCGLTKLAMEKVACPAVAEAPISIACKVAQTVRLGSHSMYIATVEEVVVDKRLLDAKGKFHLEKANLLCYAHGNYYTLAEQIGFFGWSVQKKAKPAAKTSAKTPAKPGAKPKAKPAKR
jgi:flavin reductase (DIM6/NTAB) family NADH-FMN oxidoreductase RutF